MILWGNRGRVLFVGLRFQTSFNINNESYSLAKIMCMNKLFLHGVSSEDEFEL